METKARQSFISDSENHTANILNKSDYIFLSWICAMSVLDFLFFGYDKIKSAGSGRRVSEFQLCLIAALGGWPGGFLGMLTFRHKTAKLGFKLKFTAALLVLGGLIYVRQRWR